jgi:hypothetical protein
MSKAEIYCIKCGTDHTEGIDFYQCPKRDEPKPHIWGIKMGEKKVSVSKGSIPQPKVEANNKVSLEKLTRALKRKSFYWDFSISDKANGKHTELIELKVAERLIQKYVKQLLEAKEKEAIKEFKENMLKEVVKLRDYHNREKLFPLEVDDIIDGIEEYLNEDIVLEEQDTIYTDLLGNVPASEIFTLEGGKRFVSLDYLKEYMKSMSKEFYKLKNGMLVRVSEISYIFSSANEGLIGLRQHPVNFNLELEDYIALSKILYDE